MGLQRFRAADLPSMPWKNGGGSTREIACWPPGSGLQDFGWRASIATIAQAGPFSVFAGVDRSITLLEGDGVRLVSEADRIDHRLDTPGKPFAFAGDAHIDCRLLGGVSTDFNIMTRRGQLRADVRLLHDATQLPGAMHGVLLVLAGRWLLTGHERDGERGHVELAEGEGAFWMDLPQSLRVEPDESPRGPAKLLAVCIDGGCAA